MEETNKINPVFKYGGETSNYKELNTREFFEKTAHFASISRAKFYIRTFPSCLNIEKIQERYNEEELDLIYKAKQLLQTGIVAKSTTLPQQSLIQENGFSYGGPTRKHPVVQQFNDIDVEFLLMGSNVNEARSIYFLFSEWQKLIAGPRNIRNTEIPRSDSTAYAIEYYDNYIAEAEISIFSPTVSANFETGGNVPIITNKYSELYPVSIGSIFTSWDSTDIPASLTITFCYYYSSYQLLSY